MTTTRPRLSDDTAPTAARPHPQHRTPQHRNEITIAGELVAPLEARVRADGQEVLTFRLSVRTAGDPGSGAAASTNANNRAVGPSPRRDVIDCVVMAGPVRRRLEQYHPADTVEVQGTLRHRFFNAGGRVQSRYEVEVARLKRLARERTARSAQLPEPAD